MHTTARARAPAVWALFLVVAAGHLRAGTDEPGPNRSMPRPHEDVVRAFLDAWRVKDEAAMKEIASKSEPDPWLVADDLLFQEQAQAARAFVAASPPALAGRLADYVASDEYPAARREMRRSAVRASAASTPTDALGATSDVERASDDVPSIAMLSLRAKALAGLGRAKEADALYAEQVVRARRMGWPSSEASALAARGFLAVEHGDPRAAKVLLEQAIAIHEATGDARGLVLSLVNLGNALSSLGEPAAAVKASIRALALATDRGFAGPDISALVNLAAGLLEQSKFAAARDHLERAVALAASRGDRRRELQASATLVATYAQLGQSAKALAVSDRTQILVQGEKNPRLLAYVLGNRANLYIGLRDFAAARPLLEQVLEILEREGDARGITTTHLSLGVVRMELGDGDGALASYEEARRGTEATGDSRMEGIALRNLASMWTRRREFDRAAAALARARSLAERTGDRVTLMSLAVMQGHWHDERQELEPAAEAYEKALTMARKMSLAEGEWQALSGLAVVRRIQKRYAEALELAREGVGSSRAALGGLPDQTAAESRRDVARFTDEGVASSVALKRTDDAVYFLESGRAGALLEALQVRDSLSESVLPPDVREAETAARTKVADAARRLRAAVVDGDREATRALRAELEQARSAHESAIDAIRRVAKGPSDLLYPEPDALPEIRSRLREDEALVLYWMSDLRAACACVVRPSGAEMVRLVDTTRIEALCASLNLADPKADPSPTLADLREALVAPLHLGEGVHRVLVSPDGVLGYVPFSLLFPDREVAFVPSGTTYGLLRGPAGAAGVGVLALGDPDYGVPPPSAAAQVFQRDGWRLTRLPGTREEAGAVGDVVLLDAEATEPSFRAALAARPRWRAVHLACHGLIDPQRPRRSSLALTPSQDDDGFLSVLEILQQQVRADLVVLSACETAKGAAARGEGIVGLMRAFLFAGAPRVICSLWKVDDAATLALMKEFYARWNPKDGSRGLGPADALRAAQQAVRSAHPEWEHPYYWAAWVLWGLPE